MISPTARRSRHSRSQSRCAVVVMGVALVAMGVMLAALAGAAPAFAQARTHWRLESRAVPTNLPLEGEGVIDVTLANLGAADVNGEAGNGGEGVDITDNLPASLEATHVEATSKGTPRSEAHNVENPHGIRCSVVGKTTITCTYGDTLPPYEQLEIYINVKVNTKTAEEPENEVTVTGGEAKPESLHRPLQVNGEATKFGVEHEGYELATEDENGEPDIQAGSHPFQMTTTFNLNQTLGLDYNPTTGASEEVPSAPALERNLDVELPPGLIGDANVVGQCTASDFGSEDEGTINSCPESTVVGVATFTFNDPNILKQYTKIVPVFNLIPSPGEPAEFGFEAEQVHVVLNTSVRTGGDYGVTVSVDNASESVQLLGSRVTIWGVPGEASHNEARGWACLGYKSEGFLPPCGAEAAVPKPFLTLPTSCAAQPETSVTGESWPNGETGEVLKLSEVRDTLPQLSGCNLLGFSPQMSVEAVSSEANTPTGLTVGVEMPQEAEGLAESAVKGTKVVLPPGVLLSPSAANGLEACAEETIGYTGEKPFEKTFMDTFTAGFDLESTPPPQLGVNFCPDASKVGVVHIKSPDLPVHLPNGETGTQELEGSVYLASQNANPFGSLFAMYIVAEEKETGVLVKLAGEVKVEPTGQIISTFENTPEVPFEELKLELFSGPRASITTPPSCGSYPVDAYFTPWSKGEEATSSPTFSITSGPGGSACSNPQPFAPSFQAGSTNDQAGAFTSFALTIGRPDADQALTSVEMTLPEGLAGVLASVTPCEEPAASLGTCGPESLIGEATATAGLGGEPFTETGGRVYITEKYDGAPFGLSVVVPAKAGPFNLGNVVTRSTINVNPSTAALTIGSTLPTMVNTVSSESYNTGVPLLETGLPVQLKQIHVVVNRANFQFNPTNCSPMAVTGELGGAQGGSEAVSSPFQVSNCASLPFAPKLTASVVGHGSKADGTTFAVKIESPGLGQANIHKVDLTIPASLPSRLTTLQKACLDAVFVANPAACDEGSVIGEGIVHTPVFKNPLRGPAYLVSHGGEAFPDVEFVLQGEGVTIVLDGKTDIKDGVTYSKFETSPDAPFTTFETVLPAGPHSALTPSVSEAEDFSLCKTTLALPTEITAQNGAFISQDTKVAVTGCSGVLHYKATSAELLAKALKACKKDKKKSKRLACEKTARKKYGKKAKKTSKKEASKKKK